MTGRINGKLNSAQIEKTVREMLAGDELALARLISLAEKENPAIPGIMRSLSQYTGKASRIGITGPPGVGKSTLMNRLTATIREKDCSVAILAVDPTSPFTGGAVLGDRIRMQQHYIDNNVFIRSMATRGISGGLAAVINSAVDIADASGKDYILIETVGVGQSEVDIYDCADTVIVILAPDTGDSIQAMKAGLFEIADIFVVNKSDLPGATKMVSTLRMMIEAAPQKTDWTIPVIACQADHSKGVYRLFNSLLSHRAFLEISGQLALKRADQRLKQFEHLLTNQLLHRLHSDLSSGSLKQLAAKVKTGSIDPYTAVENALRRNLLPVVRNRKTG